MHCTGGSYGPGSYVVCVHLPCITLSTIVQTTKKKDAYTDGRSKGKRPNNRKMSSTTNTNCLRIVYVAFMENKRKRLIDSPLSNKNTFSGTEFSQPYTDYNFITVGAATNHAMGFKQGGLLTQLTNANDKGKRRV